LWRPRDIVTYYGIMSLLDFFVTPKNSLSDPNGDLSEKVPRRAILSANQHVAKVVEKRKHPKRHGKYNIYSREDRAEIGWTASKISVKPTAVRFTKRLGRKVNESSVRSILKA